MNNIEFAEKIKDIASNYKTLYIMGCFGAPMTAANKDRYCNNYDYNKQASRTKMIRAASADTFGFDCVCLIKGVLWGWEGDKNHVYGGAGYAVNGVPDLDANDMFNTCKNKSSDFSNIEIGEAVWMDGHIGVYVGDGLAVECTPSWSNDVQFTACNRSKSGYNRRNWTKHGKLPYVTYVTQGNPSPAPSKPDKKTIEELAYEVLDGKWGNGAERKEALTKAGYDYDAVQDKVNEILYGKKPAKKTVEELAKEVLDGKWGNGAEREKALTKAGYDYDAVQNKVNEILYGNKKSIDTIAREVLDGKWGNGTARKEALTKAGYDYYAVQDRVNEILYG